jgi:hypothetical protein
VRERGSAAFQKLVARYCGRPLAAARHPVRGHRRLPARGRNLSSLGGGLSADPFGPLLLRLAGVAALRLLA